MNGQDCKIYLNGEYFEIGNLDNFNFNIPPMPDMGMEYASPNYQTLNAEIYFTIDIEASFHIFNGSFWVKLPSDKLRFGDTVRVFINDKILIDEFLMLPIRR